MYVIHILLSIVLVMMQLPAAAQTRASQQQGSVVLDYVYKPHDSKPGLGELRLELRDAVTQQPLDYALRQLAGWLQKQPRALIENDDETSCSDKVRALASQGIGRRAAVDFNSYSLVTINSDRTVAFINPFLKLNNAKLEGIVNLPADATAYVHHTRARELWVAMRSADAIAIIDTDTRQLKRMIQFAQGSQPQALALAEQAVWVAFAGRSQWLRFDGSASETPDTSISSIPITAIYMGDKANTMLGIGQSKQLAIVRQPSQEAKVIALDSQAIAAHWGALSQRWLIATEGRQLLALDEQQALIKTVLTLEAPATQLASIDQGRYLLASMPSVARVAIVDTATMSLLQVVSVTPDVSELALSNGFAYAISPARAQASLLSLADLRTGNVKPVHISIGTPNRTNIVADNNYGISANTPDSMSMLFASPHDGHIYQYAEGMMAPVGSFSNYKRSAQALMVLNHGLQPLGNGRYRATVRHTQGGNYELVLSGVQPRFASCHKLALPEVPDLKRGALAARPLATLMRVTPGARDDMIAVEVKLEDKARHQPVTRVRDLQLLAFDKHSGWQRRAPLLEQEPGLYVAHLPAKAVAASFELLVSSATQDMPFGDGLIGRYVARQP